MGSLPPLGDADLEKKSSRVRPVFARRAGKASSVGRCPRQRVPPIGHALRRANSGCPRTERCSMPYGFSASVEPDAELGKRDERVRSAPQARPQVAFEIKRGKAV